MVCSLLFVVYATDTISQSFAAAAEQGTISGVGGLGIFFILRDAGIPWRFFFPGIYAPIRDDVLHRRLSAAARVQTGKVSKSGILGTHYRCTGCDDGYNSGTAWLKGYDIWRFVNLLSTGAAVSMFMTAVCCKPFTSTKINKLAGSVLGVYLIHDNPLVRPFLWRELLPNVAFLDEKSFALFMAVKVLAVYVVCMGIDLARRKWIEIIFQRWLDRHWNRWCIRGRKMQVWVETQLENL